jgi:hypothetical protein
VVFVLDTNRGPLDPCHEARARELLNKGKAAVFRRYPFTIILKDRAGGHVSTHRLKIDPGSKTTGIAIVQEATGKVVWAGELTHRGQAIRDALLARRASRRSRRQRHSRYRKPRFLNRRRPDGWLAPSLQHRMPMGMPLLRERRKERLPEEVQTPFMPPFVMPPCAIACSPARLKAAVPWEVFDGGIYEHRDIHRMLNRAHAIGSEWYARG